MSSLDSALRPVRDVSPIAFGGLLVVLAAGTVMAARVSTTGFVLLAAITLVALGLAALRWPRALLVVVVLAPIVDRFIIMRVMPDDVRAYTQFFSEGLLAAVGLALLADGLRRGRLVAAIRHPATIALGGFVAVAAVSALLNAVPPTVAAAGLLYTVDAVALFYLCRIVGFDQRQAQLAIGALMGAVALMALIGFLQGLLDPNLLGLSVVTGRSGEAVRVGSIVRDPNVLGTLIGMTLPFALFGTVHLSAPRARWLAGGVALLLVIALLLTYSRGSWLGIVAGLGTVLVLLDRRVFLVALGMAVVALGVATYMPRDLLVGSDPSGTPHTAPHFDAWDTTGERIGAVGEGRDLRTLFVLNAMPILRDHPLIGVGPGRYGGAVAYDLRTPIYAEYGTDKLLTAQRTVDNFWLHILIEGGVLGVTAFVAALVALGYGLLRVALDSRGARYVLAAGALGGTAMVVVSTGTTMLLEGNTVAFMFWFVLGIGSRLGPMPSAPSGSDAAAD
jgi:hypothetical protein